MRQGKNKAKLDYCLICNAEARLINYGALSCYSCKNFFRRHSSHRKTTPPCRDNGHCETTIQTRKLCASCRLNKCLAVGMSAELIRKEYRSKISRSAVKTNNHKMSVPPITSLNLLCNDRSSLNNFEWNLLSNVIHAFDRFSLVPSISRMVERLNSTESEIEVDALDTFNLLASLHTSVCSFISSTADFRVLTVAEQCSLFQRNLHGLFSFFGTFMLRDAGIFDNRKNESLVVPLYGQEIVCQAKRINIKLDYDSAIVKIIHIIFAFSSNCYTINYDRNMDKDALLRGTFRLFGSQNLYTEILWKYMIYRYGYQESIFRFTALVKQMLDLILLSAGIYTNNPHHQMLVDDLVEEAKTALVLNKNDDLPLWGKTLLLSSFKIN